MRIPAPFRAAFPSRTAERHRCQTPPAGRTAGRYVQPESAVHGARARHRLPGQNVYRLRHSNRLCLSRRLHYPPAAFASSHPDRLPVMLNDGNFHSDTVLAMAHSLRPALLNVQDHRFRGAISVVPSYCLPRCSTASRHLAMADSSTNRRSPDHMIAAIHNGDEGLPPMQRSLQRAKLPGILTL